MYRRIKLAVAVFFTIIMLLSGITVMDYQNSGNVIIKYINDPGKMYTSGHIVNTLNLFQNFTTNGTYSNYAPVKESHDMAYDDLNGYIYLSGYSPNFIYVINPVNNHIIKFIPGVSSPGDIVYDKFNHNIYVVDYSSNSVSIINTQSNQVVKNIYVGYDPVVLPYDNANKELYVTNSRCNSEPFYANGNITVINTLTEKTVQSIGVGHYPDNMYFDKNADLLFVSNRGSGNITVINTTLNKVIKNILLKPETDPQGIILNRATGFINVITEYGNIVSINPATYKITGNINTTEEAQSEVFDILNDNGYLFDNSANQISILHDSRLIMNITGIVRPVSGLFIKKLDAIYVISSTSTYIYILNATNSNMTNKILVRDHPEQMAYDSLTGNVYITNRCANNVLIMNKDEKIIGTIKVGKSPDGIAFDSYSNHLYVANTGSGDISVINALTNQVVKNISMPSDPTKILLNPADNNLYIASYCSKNITVIDTRDNKITDITSLNGNILGFTLDTENNNVYVGTAYYNNSLYVINSNNTIIARAGNYSHNPVCILYDIEDNLIYTTNINNGIMCVFDPETNTFISSFVYSTYRGSEITLDTYNHFLYVLSRNKIVSVNTTSDHFMKCIETGSRGTSSLYISSMNSIYIASSGSGTIQNLNSVCYNVTIIFHNFNATMPHYLSFDGKSFPHTFGKECVIAVNNGTYKYDIDTAYHRNVKHPVGVVKVSGDNVIINTEYRNWYKMDVFLTELIFISAGFIMGTLYVYYYVKGKYKNN